MEYTLGWFRQKYMRLVISLTHVDYHVSGLFKDFGVLDDNQSVTNSLKRNVFG